MKRLKSIPRDVRIPIFLALITSILMLVQPGIGFPAALLSGTYGWVIGLISFPMKRWRRMFACFGLIVYCVVLAWLTAIIIF